MCQNLGAASSNRVRTSQDTMDVDSVLPSASLSRSRTPSPRMAPASTRVTRDSSRMVRQPRSPNIAASSAASVTYSIEEGEDALKVLQETRATIFDDTKDGLLSLSKHHKAVFLVSPGSTTKVECSKSRDNAERAGVECST